jgi:hypothetical protein
MRYFFDIDDGKESTRDEIGYDCTRDELRRHAVAVLPDLAKDQLVVNGHHRRMTVRVRDEAGKYVFQASLEFQSRWLD